MTPPSKFVAFTNFQPNKIPKNQTMTYAPRSKCKCVASFLANFLQGGPPSSYNWSYYITCINGIMSPIVTLLITGFPGAHLVPQRKNIGLNIEKPTSWSLTSWSHSPKTPPLPPRSWGVSGVSWESYRSLHHCCCRP